MRRIYNNVWYNTQLGFWLRLCVVALVCYTKSSDDPIEVAIDDAQERVVLRVTLETVIGNAVLRPVVRANLL
jgi:hypothetical protein